MDKKDGTKAYVIKDSKILWNKDMEGNISKISINKNGYVTVILSDTTYKTVIVTYNSNGEELFKTYRSKTIAIDSCISNDNRELAFAEVSTSSTSTKSSIKVLSIDKAKTEPSSAITYTYEAPDNALVINIGYSDKNNLVCMFDTGIQIIANNESKELINLEDDKNTTFSGIDLADSVFKASEESSGLFSANTKIEIINVNNERKNIYTVKGVAKEVKTYNNIIAINLGTEIEFIDTNGWLIKKYNSSNEVKNIVLSNGIVGIVYKNKVEIINI